jgi:hypothetical protein
MTFDRYVRAVHEICKMFRKILNSIQETYVYDELHQYRLQGIYNSVRRYLLYKILT